MTDAWSLGPPPRTVSIPFAQPSGAQNSAVPGSSIHGGSNNLVSQTPVSAVSSSKGNVRVNVFGADVILNPDGSVTVTNLKDGRGQPHTVYLPYQRQIVPGHTMKVYIDGLPLNPISQEHLWLAQRARAIGVDTQLKHELSGLQRHELASIEELAEALVRGREDDARRIFQRFRHTSTDNNNFYKLARPLRTVLMVKRTPEGCLLDSVAAEVHMTYTVNSSGAVLSVYLGKRNIHIWDR